MGNLDGWAALPRALRVSSVLLALVMLAGCSLLQGPSRYGPAIITFDEVYLGSKDSMGAAHPEVTCLGGKRPDTIVHKDRSLDAYQGDWRPYGRRDEPQVRMRLELTDRGRGRFYIEFSIGDAVYRSHATSMLEVSPVWKGSAIFEHVPLVRGDPYEGLDELERLSIDWDCSVKD